MFQLTDRDKIIIDKMARRGWVSSKYLTALKHNGISLFPTHSAMTNRIHILRKNEIIESKSIKDLVKLSSFNQTSLNLTKYLSYTVFFYKIRDEWYKKFKKNYKKFADPRLIIHQIYQEYVEIYFLQEFAVKNIESNPDFKPIPDLYFNYNNKKITVEIERTVKRNPNDLTVKKKNKDGTINEYKRKAFKYEKHIDELLNFSDLIIYLFETDKELQKFLKNTYSKRLYCSTINNLHELIDSKGEKILTKDLLNESK